MTLKELINKIVSLPDGPLGEKTKVSISDGQEVTDIWLRGDGVVIIEINKRDKQK